MSNNKGWTEEADINWDDVSTEAPKPIDADLYNANIVAAEFRKSNAGNPCVNLELAVTGVFQGDELSTPKKHYHTLVFTADCAFRVKQAAVAAGVEPPKRASEEVLKEFGDSLVGAAVIVKTKHEKHRTDKNRTLSVVDRFLTQAQAERIKSGGSADDDSPATAAAAPKRSRRGAAA
jgi:hypothetical protein